MSIYCTIYTQYGNTKWWVEWISIGKKLSFSITFEYTELLITRSSNLLLWLKMKLNREKCNKFNELINEASTEFKVYNGITIMLL